MLLAWAVSCDSYELRDDGTADIFGAGTDTFYVDQLPTEIDLTILVRLLLLEDEQSELELHILGPQTNPLRSFTWPVESDPGPNHRPGYIVSQIEALEIVGIPVETEGPYSVEIYADARPDRLTDEHRRSIHFYVREGMPTS